MFIGEKNDIALLKAKNFKSNTWAKIRLNERTKKCEEIIAIGNPTIDSDSFFEKSLYNLHILD